MERKLTLTAIKYDISRNAMSEVIKHYNESLEELQKLLASQKKLASYKTLKRRLLKEIPGVMIIAYYRRKEDNEIIEVGPVKTLPVKKYPRSRFQLLQETTYIEVIKVPFKKLYFAT